MNAGSLITRVITTLSQPAQVITHITPPYRGCVCDKVSCDVIGGKYATKV
jgi:hypothetical protein